MTWLDFAAIRARVKLQDVLALLNWQPLRQRGDQLRGSCPFCHAHANRHGRHRIFSVNLTRQTYRCFTCQRAGNALDLWADHARLPIHRATRELCHRLNIPLEQVTSRNLTTSARPPGITQPATPPPRDNGRGSGCH